MRKLVKDADLNGFADDHYYDDQTVMIDVKQELIVKLTGIKKKMKTRRILQISTLMARTTNVTITSVVDE